LLAADGATAVTVVVAWSPLTVMSAVVWNCVPSSVCTSVPAGMSAAPGATVKVMVPVAGVAARRCTPQMEAQRSRNSASAVSMMIWRLIHSMKPYRPWATPASTRA
jgi:hypothetical protein